MLVSSVPLSLTTVIGLAIRSMIVTSSSHPTRASDSDVSAASARIPGYSHRYAQDAEPAATGKPNAV
jgi:hypothetical protein